MSERKGYPEPSKEVWEDNYKAPGEQTLQDTWGRQARACAAVEKEEVRQKVYEDFLWLLTDFKGIAGGRITANLGVPGRSATTLMNCFLRNTYILTDNGYKYIQDIKIGEKVLTHTGKWQKVVNTLVRNYSGSINIYESSYLLAPLKVTTEHPIYQGEEKWVEAKAAEAMAFPTIKNKKAYIKIDIKEYFNSKNYFSNKTHIWASKEAVGGNGAKLNKSCEKINRFITVNENSAYLFGRFVGDGSVYKTNSKSKNKYYTYNGINIIFSSAEWAEMLWCQQLFNEIFGIEININFGNTFHYIRKAHGIIPDFIEKIIGKNFNNKRVPEFILKSNKDVIESFLLGVIDSDGTVTKQGRVQITLANEKLINDLIPLFNSIGIFPRKNKAYTKHIENASDAWRISFGLNDSYKLLPKLHKHYSDERLRHEPSHLPNYKLNYLKDCVTTCDFKKKTKKYIGKVYNLSVENDESYIANGIVVHNCFVHAPSDLKYTDPDSIAGIYDMLKAQAQTLKSEGGYGMNFSWIRPAGAYVQGIASRTPGVLKFMEMWDKSSEIITMGSEKTVGERRADEKKKIRKGAQMAIVNCWHPEVEDFIDAKLVEGRLTKFNLSVGITPGFMQAVQNDDVWHLKFPDTTHSQYKEEWSGILEAWENKGYPVVVYKTLRAKDLWEKIMRSTYTRNDPGVLFLDIANKLNPLYYAEYVQTTNPCGEIAMSTGVCLLFSLNLVKYVKQENNKYSFDFDTFKKAVSIAIRFADNINDISNTPLSEYSKSMQEKRRIGVGVLGLGSLHFMLGIRFGSKESLELIDQIFKTKAETELFTSASLGAEKGSFTLFNKHSYFNTHWWKTLPISELVKDEIETIGEMRNSHHSANAPTGNMSIYAECVSGGIEPVFAKEYYRWMIVPEAERARLRSEGFTFPDIFKGEWFETEYMKESKAGSDSVLLGTFKDVEYQVDKNRGLTKKIAVRDYGWQFVLEDKRAIDESIYATANELSVEDHVNTLKVIAKYVNMNSSKTVNLPNDYPYESFKNLYLDAYLAGIKGITSYRAGTMTAVLENKDAVKTIELNNDGRYAPKRPQKLGSETHKIKIDFGNGEPRNAYVTVSFFENTRKPYEMFIVAPYQGLEEKDLQILELSARNTSLMLRHGIPIKFICEQLDRTAGQYIFSIPTNISKVLKQYDQVEENSADEAGLGKCPSCGKRTYMLASGCGICKECNYSGCS